LRHNLSWWSEMSDFITKKKPELDAGSVNEIKSRKERKQSRMKEVLERGRRMMKEWDKDFPNPEARRRFEIDYVLRRYLERGLDDPAVRAKDWLMEDEVY